MGRFFGATSTPEAATYGALASSGANGDLAVVTGNGAFRFVSTVGGYDVQKWVPAWVYDRGLAYVEDASGNPCRISSVNGVGGEDLETLTGRGWDADLGGSETGTDPITGTNGSVSSTSDDIVLTDNAAGAGGTSVQLAFTPSLATNEDLFVIFEASGPAYVADANPYWRSVLFFQDSVVSSGLSLSAGAAQTLRWTSSSSALVGTAAQSQTAFDTWFGLLPWKGATTATRKVWSAADGQGLVGGKEVTAADTLFPNYGLHRVQLFADVLPSTAGGITVRELHVFILG